MALAPLPSLVRDLVVVGGGPVGLLAAIEARRAGLRVVVVEPRTTPVDKACGEGLMPGALAALHRLGVDPAGHPITGVAYTSADGAQRAEHAFGAGPGRGVRRTVLQEALAARATALGVRVVPGRVRELTQDGASVRLVLDGAGAPARLDARWVIAADGLHSTVRRLLGVSVASDGRRYAVRRHASVAPWSSHVEVHWGPGVEAYVTPVASDEVGVAVLGPRTADLRLDAALAELPALRERLAGAPWASAQRGAGPLRQRVGARVVERVLLVGDAAGYVDALTGEGLMIGAATARAAVEAVVAADACTTPAAAVARLHAYEGEWRRLTRSYRWLTTALVASTHARLARSRVVPLAASAPRLFGAAVEQVARSAHPPASTASTPSRGRRAGSLGRAERPPEPRATGDPA
jgi:flavin-dependent dehydrogenase